MATEVLQLGIDSTGAAEGARRFTRATQEVQGSAAKADGATKKMDSSFGKLRSSAMTLTRVLGTLGITIGAGALVRSIARATADMDTLRLSLNAVTGSSAETARQLKELREVAKLPGLGFKEAVQGAVNLEVVGFSAKETTRILKDFGNAVALTGGGKNELDRVIFQFTQMSSLGKVTSQDLKPIIQTAPAVAKAMLAVFGTISPEKIEAMGLTFDQFTARLLGGLEKLPTATGGVKNSFENLSDAAFQASAAFGTQFAGAVGDTINKLAGALQSFADNRQAVADLALGVKALTKGVGISGLATAAIVATKAMIGLAVASGATAFFALVPAITSAADAVTMLGFAVKGLYASLGPVGWFIVGAGVLATYFYNSGKAASDAVSGIDAYAASLGNLNRQQLLVEQNELNRRIHGVNQQLATTPATLGKRRIAGLMPGETGYGIEIPVKNPKYSALQTALTDLESQSKRVHDALGMIFEPPKTPTIASVLDGANKKAKEFTITLKNLAGVIAANGLGLALPSGFGAATAGGMALSTDARDQYLADRKSRAAAEANMVLSPVAVPSAPNTNQVSFFDRVKSSASQFAGGDIKGGLGTLGLSLGPLAVAAAALAPVFKGLKEALGPAISALAKPLEIIGRLIGGTVAPLLKLLEGPLTFLAKVISYVNEAFGYLIYGLAKFVDKIIPFGDPLKAIEQYGKDIIAGSKEARDALKDMGEAADKTAASLSTDLPRAINLALYRARIGAPGGGTPGGGGGGSPYTPPGGGTMPGHRPPAPAEATQQLYFAPGSIVNNAGDSPEDLARKMARGAQKLFAQGERLYAPGLVTA